MTTFLAISLPQVYNVVYISREPDICFTNDHNFEFVELPRRIQFQENPPPPEPKHMFFIFEKVVTPRFTNATSTTKYFTIFNPLSQVAYSQCQSFTIQRSQFVDTSFKF